MVPTEDDPDVFGYSLHHIFGHCANIITKGSMFRVPSSFLNWLTMEALNLALRL